MNKIIKLLVICFIVFITLCRIVSHQYQYPVGRDTHKSFGNREYQILNYTTQDKSKKTCLYNMKYNETIIEELNEYKTVRQFVYFIGNDNNVCVRLDKKTNVISYYNTDGCRLTNKDNMQKNKDLEIIDSFESFSETDRKHFSVILNETKKE